MPQTQSELDEARGLANYIKKAADDIRRIDKEIEHLQLRRHCIVNTIINGTSKHLKKLIAEE